MVRVVPFLPSGQAFQEVQEVLFLPEIQEVPMVQASLVVLEVQQVRADPPFRTLQDAQNLPAPRGFQALQALLQVPTPRLVQGAQLLQGRLTNPAVLARQGVHALQIVREYRPSQEFRAGQILLVNLGNPRDQLFLALPQVLGNQADQCLPWVRFYQYFLWFRLFL